MSANCIACGRLLDPASDIVFVKDGYDILRCSACGLMRRAVLPTEAELEQIYGIDYFQDVAGGGTDGYADYLGDEHLHRATARQRLDLIERAHGRRDGQLLDVGAASGFFVDEARCRGWDARGIDVSGEMVDWGTQHLAVPLEVANVMTATVQAGSLDVLTMWDYIEHSLDPVRELDRCKKLLAPRGLLALSTGDVGSLVARLSRSRWHLMTPRHHNFFFGDRTLRLLLARAGFEIVFVKHSGASYSLAHLTYKLDRMARARVTRAIAGGVKRSRLGGIAVPVNLFDIVTVVARSSGERDRASDRT